MTALVSFEISGGGELGAAAEITGASAMIRSATIRRTCINLDYDKVGYQPGRPGRHAYEAL
jgi:hypothetical protein